jgi:hypothetical protein
MNRDSTETTAEEVLVCGDCGRVNPFLKGLTRTSTPRCSGCGAHLFAERQRKVAIDCPGCQVRLEIDADWLGQMVVCGNCQTDFLAERSKERAIPAAPKTDDDLALEGVPARIGVVDFTEEEGLPETPPRQKVRRTRTRKRAKSKSIKEVVRAVAATTLTFGLVVGIIIEVGRRSEWWLVPTVEPEPGRELESKVVPKITVDLVPEDGAAMDAVLVRFFRALSPEDALAVCRFQEEVGGRMRAIASSIPSQPVQPAGMRVTAKHVEGERLFVRLTGKSADDPNRPVSVVLERPEPGKFLVDWDSHVRFASESWPRFTLKRDGTVGRFQLVLKRYFAGNVAYPIQEWTSFLVFREDETDGVNLFVRTDSPECARLLAASEPDLKVPVIEERRGEGGFFPVTLEVFFPPETNREGMPPALELKKFCHDGWVDLREG